MRRVADILEMLLKQEADALWTGDERIMFIPALGYKPKPDMLQKAGEFAIRQPEEYPDYV